jgi:hypothetical protein
MRNPPAPENVRAVLIDDQGESYEVPIELTYEGIDKQGQHSWVQVSPECFARSRFLGVRLKTLPGHTGVRLLIDPER